MRAIIDNTGRLTVTPETETESYALRCYAERFNSDNQPEIHFQWEEIHSPSDVRVTASYTPSRAMPLPPMNQLSDDQTHGISIIKSSVDNLARVITANTPECREQSLALIALENVIKLSSSAILGNK